MEIMIPNGTHRFDVFDCYDRFGKQIVPGDFTPKQLFFSTTFLIIVPTIFISTTIYYIILLYD